MKNKKLLLIVSLALAMMMSLGGTLAYLTDTDGDVNTMVLGNVKIEQNEQQRVEIGNAAAGLESFEDGQMMLPGVYGVVDNDYSSKEDVVVGAYTVKIRDQLKNYIDKIVTVTNTGNTNAYVRTIIAIPAGINVDQGAEDVGDQWLHYNVVSDGDTTPGNGWYWGKSTEKSQEWPEQYLIEDVKLFENSDRLYDITVATNINVLAPKMTTAPSLVGLFLDNDVDLKGDWYVAKDKRANSTEDTMQVWPVDEDVKVYVLSQAVQADGFGDAFTAFTNSFGEVTADTAKAWFNDLTIKTPSDEWPSNEPRLIPAANAAELTALLEEGIPAGATVALAENADYGTVNIKGELNNVTIQGAEGMNARFIIEAGAVLENVTLTDLELDRDDSSSGYAYSGAIVISEGATVKNLVIEDTEITGEGSRSSAVNITEPTAQVTLRNVTTDGQRYAVYGYAACDSLVFEDCTFKNHSSWVVQFNGADNVGWNLTMTGNEFENCKGGIAKKGGTNHEDASVVFTNNTLTNCASHADKGHVWFQNLGNTGTNTVSGNTLDGVAWDVDIVTGLTK